LANVLPIAIVAAAAEVVFKNERLFIVYLLSGCSRSKTSLGSIGGCNNDVLPTLSDIDG
jgi:hypothetical protein